MKFEKVKTSECANNYEILGSSEASKISAISAFARTGVSNHAILEVNLKINGLIGSLWNLFPLAISAAEGNRESIKMFKLLKDQSLDEINHIMGLAEVIHHAAVKHNSDKNKKN